MILSPKPLIVALKSTDKQIKDTRKEGELNNLCHPFDNG